MVVSNRFIDLSLACPNGPIDISVVSWRVGCVVSSPFTISLSPFAFQFCLTNLETTKATKPIKQRHTKQQTLHKSPLIYLQHNTMKSFFNNQSSIALLPLLLLLLSPCEARVGADSSARNRSLAGFSDFFLQRLYPTCHRVDLNSYETIVLNMFRTYMNQFFHSITDVAMKSCSDGAVCAALCSSTTGTYRVDATAQTCTCFYEEPETGSAAPTPAPAAPAAAATTTTTTKPLSCEEQPYNPCGPGHMCASDPVVGYTCTPLPNIVGCNPVCGPHSTCNTSTKMCVCDAGYTYSAVFGCLLPAATTP
jgi:hypothetical protein